MKILVVDDRPEQRYLSEALLRAAGYEVVTAANGTEALQVLRRGGIEMVVSDLMMPGMDGFRLCHEVRQDERLKDMPFIVLTATYTDDADEVLAYRAGADRFIRNPVEPQEFLKVIQGVQQELAEGRFVPGRKVAKQETETLKLYSERLVAKLEQKVLQLEAAQLRWEQAQEGLRCSEERYRSLFEHSLDAIYITSHDGSRIEANDAWLRLFGYRRDELARLSARDMYADPAERADFLRRIGTDGFVSDEVRMRRKDGTIFVCQRSVVARTEGTGAPVTFEGIMRDITSLRKAEKLLEDSYAHTARVLRGTLEVIQEMTEARDPYTAGHQKRVAELAVAIARQMRLPEDSCVSLVRTAALIHDIGKIMVPAEILSKPGMLTQAEFSLIRAHPQVGYDILKRAELPNPVPEVVLQHHERLDGSGYPQRLAGDDILPEAQILAVADVVEAMSSHRPYRPALGIAAALSEVSGGSGTKYYPDVVNACLGVFRQEHFDFSR